MHKDKIPNPDSRDLLAYFRSLLLDARDKPDVKRESLGEKDIDGRRVVGFRLSGRGLDKWPPDTVMSLWGDPKTGLPVLIETTMAMAPNVKVTMSDFAFNVDMDESLFSVEPPAGYEVIQGPAIDVSPQEEKDLIDTFRYYSESSGGPFPNLLDMESLAPMWVKKLPPEELEELSRKGQEGPSAKYLQEIARTLVKFQPGLKFTDSLPPEADAHYAGKGVSLDAADTPIFWHRPKDAKKYRVIYADLSIRDADTPPSVPDAQPEQDLIDTFRYYSELSGGPFPDSLDLQAGFRMVLRKKLGLEKGQKPSAKQMQEVIEAQMKFQPGSTFVVSLPPEVDAHYAGEGVSLGAPDTPIFWYLPKDAKKYRVICADLSVREAETPPSVPNAQPVPAPSSPKK